MEMLKIAQAYKKKLDGLNKATEVGPLTWAQNSANKAIIFFQNPVKVFIYSCKPNDLKYKYMKQFIFVFLCFFPLFVNAQTYGTVKSHAKLMVNLSSAKGYGSSIVSLDNNQIVVGSPNNQDNGEVYIQTLTSAGAISSTLIIARNKGGFGDHNIFQQHFGAAVANAGDLTGNGINDLVIGVPFTSASNGRGAIWFLFLDSIGQVNGFNRLSDTSVVFQMN